jgi:hypothetical protein
MHVLKIVVHRSKAFPNCVTVIRNEHTHFKQVKFESGNEHVTIQAC